MTWRDYLAPIIADVILTVGRTNPQALRKALRSAYPCGERRYWPYKVWCDEIRRQVGRRSPQLSRREREAQLDLFE
jgi:hypothetical protein